MHQYRRFYANSYKTPVLQGAIRELYCLVVFLFISREFFKHAKPVSLQEIAIKQKIPHHIAQELIETMIVHGMLIESIRPKSCFVPAKPLDKMRLDEVRSIIHKTTTIQEYNPSINGEPLFKAANFILSGSAVETGMISMDEILPMLSEHSAV
jgi:membrane protein